MRAWAQAAKEFLKHFKSSPCESPVTLTRYVFPYPGQCPNRSPKIKILITRTTPITLISLISLITLITHIFFGIVNPDEPCINNTDNPCKVAYRAPATVDAAEAPALPAAPARVLEARNGVYLAVPAAAGPHARANPSTPSPRPRLALASARWRRSGGEGRTDGLLAGRAPAAQAREGTPSQIFPT
jgi:hypothetical protein